MEEKLGFGFLGNGITVWDANRTRDNAYLTVAHIHYDRTVEYYEELSAGARRHIKNFAQYENLYPASQPEMLALRPLHGSAFMSAGDKGCYLRDNDFDCPTEQIKYFLSEVWNDARTPLENRLIFHQWRADGKSTAKRLIGKPAHDMLGFLLGQFDKHTLNYRAHAEEKYSVEGLYEDKVGKWIAFDNRSRSCYVEEFDNMQNALDWLNQYTQPVAITDDEEEIVEVWTTPQTNPKTFRKRVKSLMISGLSQSKAEHIASTEPMKLELFYDVELGSFAIDAEAVGNTPLYHPYTGNEISNETT